MQTAQTVLEILQQNARTNLNYSFKRLYRNLFNPDFYLLIRQENPQVAKQYPKDHFLSAAEETISQLRSESYRFNQLPLMDQIIRGICSKILVAIYRPPRTRDTKQSRLNAIAEIKRHWSDVPSLATGRLQVTMAKDFATWRELLSRRIDDGRFVELLRRIVNAGEFGILKEIGLKLLDDYIADKVIAETNWATRYIRYQDNFLLALNSEQKPSPGELTRLIKTGVTTITVQDLQIARRVIFLQYLVASDKQRVMVAVPDRAVNDRLRDCRMQGRIIAQANLVHLPVSEIIEAFSNQARDFISYYQLAENKYYQKRKFRYYHRRSLVKTIGQKMSLSSSRVLVKYDLKAYDRVFAE